MHFAPVFSNPCREETDCKTLATISLVSCVLGPYYILAGLSDHTVRNSIVRYVSGHAAIPIKLFIGSEGFGSRVVLALLQSRPAQTTVLYDILNVTSINILEVMLFVIAKH